MQRTSNAGAIRLTAQMLHLRHLQHRPDGHSVASSQFTSQKWRPGDQMRVMSLLAPSAFLASAAGTGRLQDEILLNCCAPVDSAVTAVLAHWSAKFSQPDVLSPGGEAACKQREWDKQCVAVDVTNLLSRLPD